LPDAPLRGRPTTASSRWGCEWIPHSARRLRTPAVASSALTPPGCALCHPQPYVPSLRRGPQGCRRCDPLFAGAAARGHRLRSLNRSTVKPPSVLRYGSKISPTQRSMLRYLRAEVENNLSRAIISARFDRRNYTAMSRALGLVMLTSWSIRIDSLSYPGVGRAPS
jgi:hypothetical protein